MIWLASYPRSGNTFFRNVLYAVYGLESSTYRLRRQDKHADFQDYPVVKTHLAPEQLPKAIRNYPAVYLIRDGRDAIVSSAHRRRDMVKQGSDFYLNMLYAILAKEGAFFGGWSHNVSAWTARANLCIYFKDLIADPIREIEKLRTILPLPEPRMDKLPSFADLKAGKGRYQGGRKADKAQKFFRSGKRGGWRQEMPEELHLLFWDLHGEAMVAHGFTEGQPPPLTDADRQALAQRIIRTIQARPDADKLQNELAPAMPFLLQYGRQKGVPKYYTYEHVLLSINTGLQRLLPKAAYTAVQRSVQRLALPKLLAHLRRKINSSKLRKLK
ncbi:MAG: hypothetical protein D6772_04920 [Bacteroidetes bacterium]|nr:MAG: hypothetical protein D6772_04920 [Bacteroidota bacterium]